MQKKAGSDLLLRNSHHQATLSMEHRFYLKPESEQKSYILGLGLLIFLLIAIVLAAAFITGYYFLIVFLPLVLLTAAPFIDTPMGKRNGTLIYYSPLFIAEKKKRNKIVVHGGTLFDYVYTLDPMMNGKERTRYILIGYLQGLIQLISEYEEEKEADFNLRGTSYILNDRTARRIGFEPVPTDFIQLVILLMNYIPLTLANSYSKKRIDFPKLSRIKTYEADVSELIDRKNDFIMIEKQLKKKL